MRPLTEPETQTLFQKLAHYVRFFPPFLDTRDSHIHQDTTRSWGKARQSLFVPR